MAVGANSHNGDDTAFGFRIPRQWPRWKLQCQANRKHGNGPCKKWAVRGMPTCRMHGSGGVRNAKLGLLRYLAWVAIGVPQNRTPVEYARFGSMSAVLEALFNNGKGTEKQRIQAVMWMMEIPDLGPMDLRSLEEDT